MPTKTIKDAGGDYTTLAAWIAGEQGDLVAATEIRIADCYDLAAADTAVVDIDGSTTNASYYLQIQSHTNHNGVWTASAYELAPVTFNPSITIQDDYTRIVGLQISTTGAGAYAGQGIKVVTVGGCRIERCLIKNLYSGTNTSGINRGINAGLGVGVTVFISNNIVYGFDEDEPAEPTVGIFVGNATAYAYNNTVYGCTQGIMESGGNTCRAKNNLCAASATADFVGAFHASSDYNASSDTTAIGANKRISQTFTFVSTTGGSEDLHLTAGDAGARAHGTTLAADADYPISVDVDNATRTGTWDIGADQITVAGTGAVLLLTTTGMDNMGAMR